MSNEKRSDTNETGTVYASTSGEGTEHQVKTSVKRIVMCRYMYARPQKRKINPNPRALFYFFFFFFSVNQNFFFWSNGKDPKEVSNTFSPF